MNINLSEPAEHTDLFFTEMMFELMDKKMITEMIIKSSHFIEMNKRNGNTEKVNNWMYVHERLLESYRIRYHESDLINDLLKIINNG